MSPSASTPFGAPRTPVQFDQRTGDLRIGDHQRHVDDPAQPEQVYGAYLSLLYAVRGAGPGEQLQLRSADLEALLLIVGDDPETIESRLIDLMGCTPAEAGVLGRLLLRQRRATATLGIAVLSLAGVGLAAQLAGGDEQGAVPVTAAVGTAPEVATEQPPVVEPPAVSVLGPAAAPVETAPDAPAPVRTVAVGPRVPTSPPDAVVPAAPAAPVLAAPVLATPEAAPAPVVAAPAPVEPVSPPEPVEVIAPEDRYVLPLFERPVLDAPPPVDVPESGIDEAISLEPEELAPISGIGGSEDHVHEPVESATPTVGLVPPVPGA